MHTQRKVVQVNRFKMFVLFVQYGWAVLVGKVNLSSLCIKGLLADLNGDLSKYTIKATVNINPIIDFKSKSAVKRGYDYIMSRRNVITGEVVVVLPRQKWGGVSLETATKWAADENSRIGGNRTGDWLFYAEVVEVLK